MALGPRTPIELTMQLIPSAAILETDFKTLGLTVRSFREPLNRIVREVAIPSIRENFEQGGRPGWRPLAQTTREIRSRQGYTPDDPLWRSAVLVNAATQVSDWTVTSEAAFISNLPERAWYGVLHDQGLGGMPQRQFFMWQDEDIERADQIFEEWLKGRLAAHGFSTDIAVGESGGFEAAE